MITPLQVNDKTYRINNDSGPYLQVQINEMVKHHWYEAPIPEVGTVIDAGANVGLYSLYISEHAKTVYSIEPQTKMFDYLTQNIKENKKTNIKAYNFALTGTAGKRWLYTSYNKEDNSGYSLLPVGEYVETVNCKTLAKFIKDEDIKTVHILKMDIEGLEQEVFSADDFGEVADRILCIVGEYHIQCRNLKEILEWRGFSYSLNSVGIFTAVRKTAVTPEILLPK